MEEIAKKIFEKASELSSMISEAKLEDVHFAMVLHVPKEDGDNEEANCVGVMSGRPAEIAQLLNRLIRDTDMEKYLALDKLIGMFNVDSKDSEEENDGLLAPDDKEEAEQG